MKTLEIAAKISILDDIELTETQKNVIEAAKSATYRSFSPHSHFCVGAACLLSNGQTVCGANQENDAFPSGLCAERTALFAAQAQHPEASVVMLAIVARTAEGVWTTAPTPPCGACRQVMAGIEQRYGRPMQVLLPSPSGTYIIDSAADLLPLSFVL